MDKKSLPAQRVTIKLTPRQKEDPEAILKAVRVALSMQDIGLRVETAELPSVIEDSLLEDENLSTKARLLASVVLEKAAAEAAEQAAKSECKKARSLAEIAAIRKGAISYLIFWCGQGLRIVIEVCENTVGRAGKFIGEALGSSDKSDG